ncbi:MAG TPA: XTP/dITP diphosphatase [Bacteroidota bacterium]|nr:XTP/dITP diphosphatase [Bacteroidota bacterium]
MKQLLFASRNRNKVREVKTLLNDFDLTILSLDDFPAVPPTTEDGETFVQNALKKAREAFRHTGIPTLADDSGLEVFFLNGRPGVYSAHYAGEHGNDDANNKKLLEEMRGVAPRRRRAQFKAVMALVGPGYEKVVEGICVGRLAEGPRGTNGFGYDPIFIPDGYAQTFGELPDDIKNKISHRARAIQAIKEILKKRLED